MSARPPALSDFDYDLPPAQIARRPPPRRDGARLLDMRGAPRADVFSSLPKLLRPGDVLVLNDSKVIPARLLGKKETGGAAEIFAERFLPCGDMVAMVRAAKPPQIGAKLFAGGGAFVVLAKTADGFFRLRAQNQNGKQVNARARFLRHGQTPLPPYLRRPPDDEDKHRYQTVFARSLGSVAAPTAGLHFTPEIFAALAARGIQTAKITLHVGAGTFLPPRRGMPNQLHSERYVISAAAAKKINAAKQKGGRIAAAGTTTLRALESAADENGVHAANTETELFIKPGRRFLTADLLLTNFHLPKSTLLILACAFGGMRRVLAGYRFAVQNKFRFYSYGDAMLLSRHDIADAV